jgi:hypothetical protein
MKKAILVTAMCLGLVVVMSVRAAGKAESPSLAVLSDNKASASEKVSAIQAYVRSVEKNISSSQRKEQMLSPAELKKVTNENWTKIHTYSDGADLKRMKLYPPAGSQRQRSFTITTANRSSSFWKQTELAKRTTIKMQPEINTILPMEN